MPAIEHELAAAEKAYTDAGLYLAWLQGVKRRRENEVAKGEWP